jgi:hypothetical protein
MKDSVVFVLKLLKLCFPEELLNAAETGGYHMRNIENDSNIAA